MPHPRVSLPRIRGTQIGLRNWSLVDQLKSDMRSARYAFHERRGQIGGVRDRRGVYYVVEGHHRLVAALELFNETGDSTAIVELLNGGLWTEVNRPPFDGRPLPSRSYWGAFRNWLGY
jgi:hypothetical protein